MASLIYNREPSPLIYNFTKDRKPAACAAHGGAAAPAPAGAMPTAVGASHGPGGEGGAAGVAPQAVASCKISVTGPSPSSGETSVAVTRKDIAALVAMSLRLSAPVGAAQIEPEEEISDEARALLG